MKHIELKTLIVLTDKDFESEDVQNWLKEIKSGQAQKDFLKDCAAADEGPKPVKCKITYTVNNK